MNKKALLGSIFIGVVLALVLIGGFLYYQIKNEGIQISSGNIIIDIKLNDTENPRITGDTIKDLNFTGINESEENESVNQTNKTD